MSRNVVHTSTEAEVEEIEKPAAVVAVDDDKQSYRCSNRKRHPAIQSSDSEDSVVHVCRPVQKKNVLKKNDKKKSWFIVVFLLLLLLLLLSLVTINIRIVVVTVVNVILIIVVIVIIIIIIIIIIVAVVLVK